MMGTADTGDTLELTQFPAQLALGRILVRSSKVTRQSRVQDLSKAKVQLKGSVNWVNEGSARASGTYAGDLWSDIGSLQAVSQHIVQLYVFKIEVCK